MDCFGYCRVSTDEQAEEGLSLDAQRSKIKGYAELHDHTLIDVHMDEGVSGKAMKNRPGLLTVLDKVCDCGGLLVIYSLSRLGRNTKELIDMSERLKGAGAQLASITEHFDTTTASGTMFFKLMAVLAEFERDQLVERTNLAINRKRELGEVIGNVPYGFTRAGEAKTEPLTTCEDELSGLRMILDQMDSLGYAEIARNLDAAGHKPRNGTAWDRGVVRRIVKFHKSQKGIDLRNQHQIRSTP